jgi:hypothetical protein
MYSGAIRTATAIRPGLDVSGNGTGCNTVTGRFHLRELVTGMDGTVERLALDIEQHCNDTGPGLFMSVRHQSTVADVRPFEGAYPVFRLVLGTPVYGTITAGALPCGTGGGFCTQEFSAATSLTLVATPDPGYFFAGWTGECVGPTTTSLMVNGPRSCSAEFQPVFTLIPRTSLILQSMADATGTTSPAKSEGFSLSNATWAITRSVDGKRLTIRLDTVASNGFPDVRIFDFTAPAGQSLATGATHAATAYPSAQALAGMRTGACGTLTGRFVVHELAVASGGQVARLSIYFEEHCEDRTPATLGALR